MTSSANRDDRRRTCRNHQLLTREGLDDSTTPKQGPEAERIDRLLETPDTCRLHVIETVFANTKFNRGIRRFNRRWFPGTAGLRFLTSFLLPEAHAASATAIGATSCHTTKRAALYRQRFRK
jgi:hypothetical protein